MESCKIISCSAQKGGVGKTTTVCNLGNALAGAGKRVLLADMDAQANLTMSFGIERPEKLAMTMHEILTNITDGREMPKENDFILSGDKLDIIPSNMNLSVTEINLRNELGGERILYELLQPLCADYDYIIIDCAPSLSMLTINALAASDGVIIPVNPQLWSATGLVDLLQTISKVKRKINPRIEVEGILMTMCDVRTRLYRETRAMLEDFCKDRIKIFDTHIPSTVKVGEANYSSVSIMDFAPNSKAAIAYVEFAKEVISHDGI